MLRERPVPWTRIVTRPLQRAGRRGARWSSLSPPRAQRLPERLPALDGARLILIALVVAGHLLEQLVDAGPLAATLYRWVYLFHMPAFVLISGALSKTTLDRRRALGLATGLLIPYLLFQTLYAGWNAWLFGDAWSRDYLTPYWLLWYLPSLACWRIMLPVFARLEYLALPVAVLVALAAGFAPWIGYPFSLSRTLVFFPLFLLGHVVGAPRLQRFGAIRHARTMALLALASAAVGAWLLRDADPQWLYASVDYAALGVAAVPGAAIRLGLLCASAICALALLALVPRRPRWAALGRRSLTAYLMHGFLVRGLLAVGVFAWLGGTLPQPAQGIVCVVAGLLIAAALSTRVADRLAMPLTRPLAWPREATRGASTAIRSRME